MRRMAKKLEDEFQRADDHHVAMAVIHALKDHVQIRHDGLRTVGTIHVLKGLS